MSKFLQELGLRILVIMTSLGLCGQDLQAGTQMEAETAVQAGTQMEAETAVQAGTQMEVETAVQTGTQMKAEIAVQTGTQIETETAVQTAVQTGTQIETETVVQTGTQTEPPTVTEQVKGQMDLKEELPGLFEQNLTEASDRLKAYPGVRGPISDVGSTPSAKLWLLPEFQGLKVDLWYDGEAMKKITFVPAPPEKYLKKEDMISLLTYLGFDSLKLQGESKSGTSGYTYYNSSLGGIPVVVVTKGTIPPTTEESKEWLSFVSIETIEKAQ